MAVFPYVKFLPNKTYMGSDMDVVRIAAQKIGFHILVKEEAFLIDRDPVTKRWTVIIGSVSSSVDFHYP